MKGKMKIIGCGGAGISVVSQVGEKLKALGSGFSDINLDYIDTSKNNIATVPNGEKSFFKIDTKSHTKEEVAGSGGDRKTHALDIMDGVKEYLDNRKIKEAVTGDYYFVTFSGSGGSGNVIGLFLVQSLLKMNIPVTAVVIGDSTNGLFAMNTLDTIASLHGSVTKLDKALTVIYVNNEAYKSNGHSNAIKEANMSIFNSMSAMSLFLSGCNLDIDAQDMRNIIDQKNYNKLNIPAGLYALSAFSKDVVIPDGCKPTVARTLTTDVASPDINIEGLHHHKVGKILDENALSVYSEYAPVHLVTYANFFTMETARLKSYTDNMITDMNNIEINTIEGTSNSEIDEDTGMVF